MFEDLKGAFTSDAWWAHAAFLLAFYILAWIVHRVAPLLSRYIVRISRLTPKGRRPRPERRQTLREMITGAISLIAFGVATLATVGRFVDVDTLVWMVGLFSAAFGLSARPIISDVLSGVQLLFEDTFAVGEKVEILGVEGLIEAVNLRTTWLRAPTGELYVVPNGEIRVVRNFTRGRFSTAKATLRIATGDLRQALAILEGLGNEAVALLPNLLEPWQVISESGVVGRQTELTLLAKARFGQAAEMGPRLLALVEERLSEGGIALVD
jgi:small conductance mechanosensitive channel